MGVPYTDHVVVSSFNQCHAPSRGDNAADLHSLNINKHSDLCMLRRVNG